ncbi:MAG TPA: hypothetical protein VIJ01_20550 [Candidatus Angelobacter sp.]
MSKQPHHQRGAESMGGGNSGREPQIQSGAGMSSKKTNAGRKKSATKSQTKTKRADPGTRRACPRQIAAVQQRMPAVLAGILFK